MSSEQLADGVNPLDAELAATWDVLKGYSGRDTDLGIARRFGGSAAAYSLRDIGAMNGPVVKVRREPYDTSVTETQDEQDFSANQVQSGALEDWVNGKLEDTLPTDVNYVVGLESARYFNGTNSGVVTSSISGLVNATGSIETSFAFFSKSSAIVSFEDNSDSNDNLTIQTDASGFLTLLHRTDGSTNILAKLQSLVLDDGTLHTVRWNMSSSGSQVILDGKDITSEMNFITGNSSTVKWVSDLNAPDVLSIGYRAEVSPDGFATGVVVNTTIFGTDNTTPLANYLGYGSSDYWNDTVGSLNATESNITQTWEQAQGAAAAYSLRKVKAGYSGDAVRIRRSSDSIEVDVAFDSDDKVSASSAITNVAEQGGESGQTTATTLGGFLTEQSFFYKQEDNSASSTYNLSRSATRWGFSKVSSVSDGTTTKTGEILKLEATGTAGTFYVFTNPALSSTGHETTITFDYLFPSTNSDTDIYVNVNDSATTGASSPSVTPNDINGSVSGTWTTASHTFSSASSGSIAIRLTSSPTSNTAGSVTPDAGDEFYITNLKISTVKADAFVHTWYDQSISNVDAVQATADNQPKIAENGALLADGLLFDGTNSFMQTTAGFALTASDDLSFSVVLQSSNLSATQNVISQENGTGTGRSWLILSSDDLQTFLGGSAALFGTFTTNKFLYTSIYDDSAATIDAFKDSATSGSQLTSKSVEAASGALNIGESKAGTNRLDGSIEEIIIYKSDQTDNRFKIESNINNYYGLYTFQGDGFVHTWYDQSGNGNDAVQGTAANQPAIVTSGSLNDGLTFDGTNDFLQTSTQVLTGTETGSNGIYAVVNVTSGDAGYVAGSASDDSGGDKVGQSIYASSASSKFILTNGLDADASDRDTIAITVGSFVLISACYNNNDADTLQKNSSTTGYTNGSLAYDFNAGTKFTIGHRERSAGVNPATNLNGSIKEVIAFDIDTTSDRSEIQADIQNHYNL